MPYVITANHLAAGDVVFLGEAGWTPRIERARLADDNERLAELEARARADAQAAIVVEPYPIEVAREGSCVVPVKLRERLRTMGPSVRPDLGYQAAP